MKIRFLGLGRQGEKLRDGPFEGGGPAFMFFIFSFSSIFCLSWNKKFLLSFKHISFLAQVSPFSHRCFLRSRCSMKMWCLDDTGRDGWDWVGPPSW